MSVILFENRYFPDHRRWLKCIFLNRIRLLNDVVFAFVNCVLESHLHIAALPRDVDSKETVTIV